MNIEDKRAIGKQTADIGDMIITDKGRKYIVMIVLEDFGGDYIGLYDLNNNSITNTNRKKPYAIGEVLFNNTIVNTIVEIIPKDRLKLVIE